MKKTIKYISFFIILISILFIQSNISKKSFLFKLIVWEFSISRFFEPKLELISEGIVGKYPNEIKLYLRDYYFYNFSNSKNNFVLIDSLLKKNYIEYINTHNSNKEVKYVFLWNTIFNSSKVLLIEPSTIQGVHNIGLFSISVLYGKNTYLFKSVNALGKLNNLGVKYEFKKLSNSQVITNAKSFDFIFWIQSQEYLQKNFTKNKLKSVIFMNNKRKIVQYDILPNGLYSINLI